MKTQTPHARLRTLLDGTATWDAFDALCDERPDGIVSATRALLTESEGARAQTLVRFLAHWGDDEAVGALVGSLDHPDAGVVAAALEHLNRLRSRIPPPKVRALLGHPDRLVVLGALGAAGHTGDLSLAPEVAAFLHREGELQAQAAVALGRIGADAYARPLAAALPHLDDLAREAYLLALELMAAPSAIPYLVRWLETAPAAWVRPIGHLLWCLTSIEPHDVDDTIEALRAAWLSLMRSDQPDRPALALREVVVCGPRVVSFSLVGGQSRVYTAFDHADPGGLVRWSRSLYVDGQRLFDVGNDGGTCEALLTLAGWPRERARLAAGQLATEVDGLELLDEEAVHRCLPLLSTMRSGRYLAALLDVPIERIDQPHLSWLSRRRRARAGTAPPDMAWADGPEPSAPLADLVHYQTPMALGFDPPTHALMMPSQPTAKVDGRHAEALAERLRAGQRPAVIAQGWVDDRFVDARVASRLLEMVVIDGHHRLEAYARAAVPARVLVLCRVEDSWGPPEHPARYLRACFAALGAPTTTP